MAENTPEWQFVHELKEQIQFVRDEIAEMKETIEGDPRRKWPGLVDRLEALERKETEKERLLDAWQRDQEIREALETRRKRFTTISVSALSVVSVLLSILVALNTLVGIPGAGP